MKCHHTKNLTNEARLPIGSWKRVKLRNGDEKYICGVCGKFYGYVRTYKTKRKETHD